MWLPPNGHRASGGTEAEQQGDPSTEKEGSVGLLDNLNLAGRHAVQGGAKAVDGLGGDREVLILQAHA